MINMIKADFFRILKGKAIYMIFLVVIILGIVSAVGISAGHIGISTSSNIDVNDAEFMKKLSAAKTLKDVRNVMKSGGEFPLDKDVIGQNINLYYLFIVVVVIILCVDFSNKSIKNTLSSAITRKKYYYFKTITIFAICTVLVLFNTYFFYFLNILINGKGFSSSLLDVTKLTIIQLPLIYGIISLLICFVFVLKKTSLFNAIAIPFIMAVQLLVIGITSLFRLDASWFYNYEFQFALSKLSSSIDSSYIIKCSLLGLFYIVLFNVIGYYSFKNTEIK